MYISYKVGFIMFGNSDCNSLELNFIKCEKFYYFLKENKLDLNIWGI